MVAEDMKTVFVTLNEGRVFGELSVLNIKGNKNGNKRTATIRSVGFSDCYVLTKSDLWQVLKEYPDAKKSLIEKGIVTLRITEISFLLYRKIDFEKRQFANRGGCRGI